MLLKRYLLGAALTIMTLQVTATAPLMKTPSPGFYRIMLGNYEATALSDGIIRLQADRQLLNSTPQQIAAAVVEHQSMPAGYHLG